MHRRSSLQWWGVRQASPSLEIVLSAWAGQGIESSSGQVGSSDENTGRGRHHNGGWVFIPPCMNKNRPGEDDRPIYQTLIELFGGKLKSRSLLRPELVIVPLGRCVTSPARQ
ncbi:hypothetical protein J6590_022671 [Homalodisca vitripennis]|nr:hypothetical protein J6590_022671 [Homalodisca vitripennis]